MSLIHCIWAVTLVMNGITFYYCYKTHKNLKIAEKNMDEIAERRKNNKSEFWGIVDKEKNKP